MSNRARLLNDLRGVRRRLRRKLAVSGAAFVVSGFVLACLTLFVLDWFLWLPGPLRLAGVILIAAGLLFGLYRRVVRPLVQPIPLVDIAVRIQEHFPQFDRGLAGAVEFIESNPDGSPALADLAIGRATHIAEKLKLDTALKPGWPERTQLVAFFAIAASVALLIGAPGWLLTGAQRCVLPFAAYEWPRQFAIAPDTRNQTAAYGESVTVAMTLTRGDADRARPVVVTRNDAGQLTRTPMQRRNDTGFRRTFEGVTAPFAYWFEAGDATTFEDASRVQLVHRPAVRQVTLDVRAPDYAGDDTTRTYVLGDRTPSVVEHSTATLTIAAVNTPTESAHPFRAWIEDETAGRIPLTLSDAADGTLTADLTLQQPMAFSVQLETTFDGEHFANRDADTYRIDVSPDRAPDVQVVSPAPILEVTPDADVTVAAETRDDFGFRRFEIVPLDDLAAFEPIDLMPVAQPAATDNGVSLTATYVWPLSPMQLPEGAVLAWAVEVEDTFEFAGVRHPPVQSRTCRLRIISQETLLQRTAESSRDLARRLAGIRDEQATLRKTLGDTLDELNDTDLSQARKMDDVRAAGAQQRRFAARTRRVAQSFDELVDLLNRNRSTDDNVREQLQRVQERLQRIADGPMNDASDAIDAIPQADDDDARTAARQDVEDAQEIAVAALDQLLGELEQWGDVQDVLRNTQRLLDRQQELRRTTARVTGKTLGRDADALDDEDKADLTARATEQDRLAEDVGKLLNELPKLAERLRGDDASAAESLSRAEQAARAGAVAERMRAAANAIRDNRGAQAEGEQQAAERAIAEMIAGMERKQDRMLAELGKKIEAAERTALDLIREQQNLLDANISSRQSTNADEEYAAQATAQDVLSRRTQVFARGLADSAETLAAAAVTKKAVRSQRSAARHLEGGNGASAEPEQASALASLNAALDALREARKQAEQALAARSLVAFREDLVDLRDRETAVGDEADALLQARGDAKRWPRKMIRDLRRVGKMQTDLADDATTVRERVAKTVVYDFAMEEIVADMRETGEQIADRELDDASRRNIDAIVAQIDRLIDALLDKDQPPDDDQFAADGGGGGGAGGGQQKDRGPVPTMAELRLLRMLQVGVNEKTKTLAGEIDMRNPTEGDLRRARDLGVRQDKIRRLGAKMIERTGLHEVQ